MKKLEAVVFYLLIFAIPVQARLILHSWSSLLSATANHLGTQPFNQWTSAYLYGTDILIAALFVFWLIRFRVWKSNFQTLRSSTPKLLNSNFWLFIFFAVSALSILNSKIIGLSLYQLLKLAEFIGFYFYLKLNFVKIFSFRGMLMVIIASGFFQSVIAITQYIKQGSLGLRLLGESPLSVNTTGVAFFIADSEKYLRAYGTTPHPNVLAAWLFVAIFAFYFYFLYFNTKSNPSEAQPANLAGWAKRDAIFFIYPVLLFAFFFTFSRVIIGFWVLGVVMRILIVFFKKDFKGISAHIKLRIVILTITSLVVAVAFSFLFWPQVKSRIHILAQDKAVTQRIFYNKLAGSIATDNPLLGAGIGQFIPKMMARLKHLPAFDYQPVHNIYLLIASETGFIGLGAFLLFLFISFWRFMSLANFKKLHTFSFLIFTSSFLLIGLFDHLLWTLQQGSFIFWMALALLSANSILVHPATEDLLKSSPRQSAGQ